MKTPIVETKYSEDKVRITITYEFDWSDFVTGKLPETCGQCPVGFMMRGCGRRVPLDFDCRPDTCKLQTLREYLDKEKSNVS